MSRTLSTKCGSPDSLNVSARCGCRPKAPQMRQIDVCDSPTSFAIDRSDQWVASRRPLGEPPLDHFRHLFVRDALRRPGRVRAETTPDALTAQMLGNELEGSGVVIDGEGLILTIDYVILEAAAVRVTTESGRCRPRAGRHHPSGRRAAGEEPARALHGDLGPRRRRRGGADDPGARRRRHGGRGEIGRPLRVLPHAAASLILVGVPILEVRVIWSWPYRLPIPSVPSSCTW